MMTVISGAESRDFYARVRRSASTIATASTRASPACASRTAATLGYAKVDPEVAACVDRAVAMLASLGAHVDEIDLALDDPIEIMQPLSVVALAIGVDPMTEAQRALLDPPLLELAKPGFGLLGALCTAPSSGSARRLAGA